MEKRVRKTGHFSTSAGLGCSYFETASLRVAKRIGELRERRIRRSISYGETIMFSQ